MSDMAFKIADRVIDIMLAESAFDGLDAVYLGVPDEVPAQVRTFAIVAVTGESDARAMSGEMVVTAYEGVIAFNVLGSDMPVISSRKAIVASYQAVTALVAAAKATFRAPQHRTLDDLAGVDWAVQGFFIADGGDVAYGYAERAERANNFENFGIVPFICAVQE